ncbi:hypothetical protein ACXIUS_29820 [Bosea thiooxidans]
MSPSISILVLLGLQSIVCARIGGTMLLYTLFAAAVGVSVGFLVGFGPGLVITLMLIAASYAAKQVIRDD